MRPTFAISRRFLTLLLIALLNVSAWKGTGADAAAMETLFSVETLRNGGVEMKIALKLGGRVISFRRLENGRNILLFNPPTRDGSIFLPKPSVTGYFPMCAGHVIWVGPQKRWWSQQTVNLDRAKRKAIWPPDPYLCVGEYQVLSRSEKRLVIVGPSSPVCGLRLNKSYELKDDGEVVLSVSAENISRKTKRWDIWSNTRLPATAKPFVPLEKVDGEFVLRLSFETKHPDSERQLPSEISDGIFTFAPSGKRDGRAEIAKAYINSKFGVICAISGEQLFVKSTRPIDPEFIARDQAFIEIYQKIGEKNGNGVLELEFHGAERTLEPGEKMEFTETWRLLPFKNNANSKSLTAAIWKAANINSSK